MRSFEKWKSTREKGFTRFLLIHGLVAWGLPMFLFMALFMHWGDLSPLRLAVSAAIWAVAGIAFGAFMWVANERQYRKRFGGA